jgi:glycosyltransferase involved in cell wall biosynthesis
VFLAFARISTEWRWLGEREDIREILRSHHALVHPSLYAGLPNAVCEALASGRPALVSDVATMANESTTVSGGSSRSPERREYFKGH